MSLERAQKRRRSVFFSAAQPAGLTGTTRDQCWKIPFLGRGFLGERPLEDHQEVGTTQRDSRNLPALLPLAGKELCEGGRWALPLLIDSQHGPRSRIHNHLQRQVFPLLLFHVPPFPSCPRTHSALYHMPVELARRWWRGTGAGYASSAAIAVAKLCWLGLT